MDLRNEIEHIFKNGFDWYQRNLGEAVIWHEFDSENTEYHNTYDEGGRRYTAGAYVPALWVIITEDRATQTDQGRKPTERITMAVSARAFDLSGVSDPEEYTRHLNDVIRYDNRLWSITDINIRGRISDSVIIGISGTQIYSDEEMTFDSLPPGMDLAGNHRTLAYPNNADTVFLAHDAPGQFVSFYADLDYDIVLDGGAADDGPDQYDSIVQDPDYPAVLDGGTAETP